MVNANYTTSGTPSLKISCHNDLSIVGTTDNTVLIEIDDDSPASRIDRHDEEINVTAMGDCSISCPGGTSLSIELVSGDIRVTHILGQIIIQTVNGDSVLHEVGPVLLQTIQGDLVLRNADGPVQIETVRGDAKLKRIAGQVSISKVAGDCTVQDLGAGLALGQVGGDLAVEVEFQPGQSYVAKAGGDIVLRVDGGGAQFTLNAKGDLRVRVPLTNWTGNDRSATGTIGDGAAQVTLLANGDVLVLPGAAGAPFDADQFSDQVEAMIESAMGQFESQMARMQRDMEQRFGKMDKHAAKAAERANRRAERAAGSWSFSFGRPPFPPTPPAPSSQPVSDQERLMILKMVEEGKINVDQAAELLAALEG
jgi:hypothetical protein